ncbi:MAG: hypothetical protein JWQ25_1436 [Daejeonella sp.]|nr:hypothetical protein [Daejeonella sp.]
MLTRVKEGYPIVAFGSLFIFSNVATNFVNRIISRKLHLIQN